jgi:hypothetical protein
MREYTKLLIVAIFASAITFGATQLLQSEPVQAAPAADALPPDFKKDMWLSFGTTEKGGTIVATYGDWIKVNDGSEDWWLNVENPGLYIQLTKGE